jgi:hypothetical protein
MVCVDVDTNVVFGTLAHAYEVSQMEINEMVEIDVPATIKKYIKCNCTDFLCPADYIKEFGDLCANGKFRSVG